MSNKGFVLDFIKKHKLAVLATVDSSNRPEDAVMGFGGNEKLELVFGTSTLTRKFVNIKNNPNVAVVIGWDEGKTVQYEGIATILKGKELKEFKKLYFAKNPRSKKYEKHPEQVYFKVSPKWIRYTDLTQEPWKIIEIEF